MRHNHIHGLAAVSILWGTVWLGPHPLRAQSEGPAHGSIEIGVRAIAGDHASSKFNEYRDIP